MPNRTSRRMTSGKMNNGRMPKGSKLKRGTSRPSHIPTNLRDTDRVQRRLGPVWLCLGTQTRTSRRMNMERMNNETIIKTRRSRPTGAYASKRLCHSTERNRVQHHDYLHLHLDYLHTFIQHHDYLHPTPRLATSRRSSHSCFETHSGTSEVVLSAHDKPRQSFRPILGQHTTQPTSPFDVYPHPPMTQSSLIRFDQQRIRQTRHNNLSANATNTARSQGPRTTLPLQHLQLHDTVVEDEEQEDDGEPSSEEDAVDGDAYQDNPDIMVITSGMDEDEKMALVDDQDLLLDKVYEAQMKHYQAQASKKEERGRFSAP